MPEGYHYPLVRNAGRTNGSVPRWDAELNRYVPASWPTGEGVPGGSSSRSSAVMRLLSDGDPVDLGSEEFSGVESIGLIDVRSGSPSKIVVKMPPVSEFEGQSFHLALISSSGDFWTNRFEIDEGGPVLQLSPLIHYLVSIATLVTPAVVFVPPSDFQVGWGLFGSSPGMEAGKFDLDDSSKLLLNPVLAPGAFGLKWSLSPLFVELQGSLNLLATPGDPIATDELFTISAASRILMPSGGVDVPVIVKLDDGSSAPALLQIDTPTDPEDDAVATLVDLPVSGDVVSVTVNSRWPLATS